MAKPNAVQRVFKFRKKKIETVKYYYRCPHCRYVSYQWAQEGRRTLVCDAWRCSKRFWTYPNEVTEDDWGRYEYGHNVDWRALHNEHLKRAHKYLLKWFPDHKLELV